MIKITLIAMGKLKEQYLRDAAAEYAKRLKGFCDLTTVEIEPEKLPDCPNTTLISKALKTEAVKIKAKIPSLAAVIPLCIEGKQLESEAFAQKISETAVSGNSNICFIIGSSYGLDDSIKNLALFKMSMSKMTFPHQLARVILLEQIYRAFKINSGGTYHK